MKDFRRTLIDYRSYCPTRRLHLVSHGNKSQIFHYYFSRCQSNANAFRPIWLLHCKKFNQRICFYLLNTHTRLLTYSLGHIEKKPPLKSFDDVQALISQGKKRELKLLLRENAWPINSTIRAQLWPAICSQHQVGKSMLEGYYWDMVNQVKITFIALIYHTSNPQRP